MIDDLHAFCALVSVQTMNGGRGIGLTVAKEPTSITLDPESELERARDESNGGPVVEPRGGTRFRVIREADDPWATYDSAKLRAGLKKVVGHLSPEEGDLTIESIYRGREKVPAPHPPESVLVDSD